MKAGAFIRFLQVFLLVSLWCMPGQASKASRLASRSVNARGFLDGKTELHRACERFDVALVEQQLRDGAAVRSVSADDDTPFVLAYRAYEHSASVVKNKSALLKVATLLVEYGLRGEDMAAHFCTVLRFACEQNWLEGVQKLVFAGNHGFYIPDEYGITPLHYVCAKGFYDLAKFFIEQGAWIDIRDRKGQTPLHHAAACGQKELVSYLLSCGADPFARDDDGLTPSDRAWFRGRLAAWEAVLRAQMKKNSIVVMSEGMSDEQAAGLDWLEKWAPQYCATLRAFWRAEALTLWEAYVVSGISKPRCSALWYCTVFRVLRRAKAPILWKKRRVVSGISKPRRVPRLGSVLDPRVYKVVPLPDFGV